MISKPNKKFMSTIYIFISTFLLAACSLLSSDTSTPTPDAFLPEKSAAIMISEGNLQPKEYKYLSFTIPGNVAEILVQKGDQVSKGQLLARLGNYEQAGAALSAAEYEYQIAQQALDDLNENATLSSASAWETFLTEQQQRIEAERTWEDIDTDDYQDDIDDAGEDVAEAQEDLDDAQETFDRYVDLDEDNSTRKRYEDDLEDARRDYNEAVRKRDELIIARDLAAATLEKAKASEKLAEDEYNSRLAGPDPDELRLAEDRVASALASVQATQAALSDYEINAPFASTIVDINVVTEEEVSPSDWAILVADFSEMYAETSDLTELEVVNISDGQPVTLIPDALPELELSGTVEEISRIFRSQSGDILYDVRILLLDQDPRLRWGMTVEISFPQDE